MCSEFTITSLTASGDRALAKSTIPSLGLRGARKLRSSMTLFARAAPGEALFGEVLAAFYGGLPDERTESLIG